MVCCGFAIRVYTDLHGLQIVTSRLQVSRIIVCDQVLVQCVMVCLQEASGDTSPIPWNFAKFLVKKDGTVFGRSGIAFHKTIFPKINAKEQGQVCLVDFAGFAIRNC